MAFREPSFLFKAIVVVVVIPILASLVSTKGSSAPSDLFCHALVPHQAHVATGSAIRRPPNLIGITKRTSLLSGKSARRNHNNNWGIVMVASSTDGGESTTVAKAAPVRGNHDDGLGGGNAMTRHVKTVWGTQPNLDRFPLAHFVLGSADTPDVPPILALPQFLSSDECRQIRDWARTAIANGAKECDEYLNYRVNQEIERDGSTTEGQALIEEYLHPLDDEVEQGDLASTSSTPTRLPALTAENKGGFRIRLDDRMVEQIIKDRLLDVLDMPSRNLVFEEGAWIRPTPRTLVVRDQTVVFYSGGDGVPPHVDGKDGTMLLYLADVREDSGGRTVFPEDGFSQIPVEGTALLYRSKTELLHYSEAMRDGEEKWIMQLLLDYNHEYTPGQTVVDFSTGHSYIWDGTK